MKRLKAAVAAIAFSAVIFYAGMTVGAATSQPGSQSDPLVTKSYVDACLSEASAGYNKVVVNKGKTVMLSEGAQIILYSGSGAVSGNTEGMINVSMGEVTGSGMNLGKYNVYLAADSQTGVTAQTSMTVFVSGGYEIK